MIGFEYSLYRQKSGGRQPAAIDAEKGALLSAWQGNARATKWIDDLVERQKALCLLCGYYPSRYTVQAKDVLPVIRVLPPFVKDYYEWRGDTLATRPHFYKSETVSGLPQDEWLIVEIWDLS